MAKNATAIAAIVPPTKPSHDLPGEIVGANAALDTRSNPIFPGNAVYLGAGWTALNVTGQPRVRDNERRALRGALLRGGAAVGAERLCAHSRQLRRFGAHAGRRRIRREGDRLFGIQGQPDAGAVGTLTISGVLTWLLFAGVFGGFTAGFYSMYRKLMAAQALIRRIPVGEGVLDAILRLVRGAHPAA